MEYWLEGAIPGINPLLQPVAHALLQARKEVADALDLFPNTQLWTRPAAVASVAFHLQHLTGVLDRLFTYARGEQLSPSQLHALGREGLEDDSINLQRLLAAFDAQVAVALRQLEATPAEKLLETRGVGRKQVPSNVLGLLFHAAEHSQRHTGQLLVTAKVVTEQSGNAS